MPGPSGPFRSQAPGWELDAEGTALAFPGFDAQDRLVAQQNVFDDCQAKARSGAGACVGRPVEALEHMREVSFGDAGAVARPAAASMAATEM